MADYSIKLILTREQRRVLDRAAKVAGLKTGPWARSELLKLAVAAVVHRLSSPSKPALTGTLPPGTVKAAADLVDAVRADGHAGVAHVTSGPGFTSARHLVKTFDPDAIP